MVVHVFANWKYRNLRVSIKEGVRITYRHSSYLLSRSCCGHVHTMHAANCLNTTLYLNIPLCDLFHRRWRVIVHTIYCCCIIVSIYYKEHEQCSLSTLKIESIIIFSLHFVWPKPSHAKARSNWQQLIGNQSNKQSKYSINLWNSEKENETFPTATQ